MSEEINDNQFITIEFLKSYLDVTDSQDDNTYQSIIKSANNELKKQLVTVVDDIAGIVGSKFFDRAQDVALTFSLSIVRRDINQMYDEAKKIMTDYNSQIKSLLGDIRATAPVRTSLQAVTRDVPFEDDYFAERHLP